jgi:hypothetical protein
LLTMNQSSHFRQKYQINSQFLAERLGKFNLLQLSMVIRRQVLELPTIFYHATKQKIKLSLLLKLNSNLKLLTSSQLPIRLKTNFSPFECQNSNWESRLNSRQPYLLLVLSDSKVLSKTKTNQLLSF